MCEIWHVDPSGIRTVAMTIGTWPCHLYKADRGCAGGFFVSLSGVLEESRRIVHL